MWLERSEGNRFLLKRVIVYMRDMDKLYKITGGGIWEYER